MSGLGGTKILLGVSGGIAAYKAADLVRRLREVGVHTISIEVRDELGEPCVDEIDVIAVR